MQAQTLQYTLQYTPVWVCVTHAGGFSQVLQSVYKTVTPIHAVFSLL